MQDGRFRTSSCSRVVIHFWYLFALTSTSHNLPSSGPAGERRDELAPGTWGNINPMTQIKNKKIDNKRDADERLRDLPEWLEEFAENLEDTKVLAPAHIAHVSDSERPAKVVSRKHSICIHFPKHRNWEVCLRTKMTRALCRRRTGEAVPRAEKFGDLITADHKVFNEGSASRNNHKYAVVVRDLATQWIPFSPCKTKTSQETEKSFRKFLESSEKPTVIYTDNSL